MVCIYLFFSFIWAVTDGLYFGGGVEEGGQEDVEEGVEDGGEEDVEEGVN